MILNYFFLGSIFQFISLLAESGNDMCWNSSMEAESYKIFVVQNAPMREFPPMKGSCYRFFHEF
ncbi:MAG: hypothetical protein A2X48_02345 [Lentisphaerae bacterium GWF2_49_21]|nr:MAG: hypothetical protein A2X48_02345 [Lentisphaerae bacterium GWF2_49_21]